MKRFNVWSWALLLCLAAHAAQASTLQVGSKRFTESYILAEIVRQTVDAAGEAKAVHLQGLGNTAIVLSALQTGSIDLYPEYTGTIAREILKLGNVPVPSLTELNIRLAPMGLAAGVPLGFNNTYALAMPAALAQALHVSKLSDLAAHPTLRLGLSQEFIGRADGWAGLKQAYGLPWTTLRGLDHGLAYEAVAQGQVDVIDVYSTDAQINAHHMMVLQDDRHYFPRYDAVLLYKADLPARFPASWAAIASLQGRIDNATMRGLNAQAELEKKSFAQVAQGFLTGAGGTSAGTGTGTGASANADWWTALWAPDFSRLAGQHLALVFLSLAISMVLGVPLGVAAARWPRVGAVILATTGVLQTIPSLALLAMLIPLTGRIGLVPAFIALAVYALLPIVRNTHAGLVQVAPGLVQAAQSLGMTRAQVLRTVELPLARTTLVAGIKTSAVINVGTATIAAFIGAGGFGERIVTGLALNDKASILAGALPVAALALLMQAAFALLERALTPPALRVK